MTTNYHTPITTGAAANSSIINTPMSALDSQITANTADISALEGGADIADDVLESWAEAEAYQLTAATYDSDGVLQTGTVVWPDGSAGVFTRTTKNSTWLAVDAYTITHAASSQTVTQSAVTRDSNGNITVKPALSIA